MRREGGAQLLVGAAALGWAALVALFVSTVAYGGVWQAGLIERVLWFSPSIVALVAGLALLTIGTRRRLRDRASR